MFIALNAGAGQDADWPQIFKLSIPLVLEGTLGQRLPPWGGKYCCCVAVMCNCRRCTSCSMNIVGSADGVSNRSFSAGRQLQWKNQDVFMNRIYQVNISLQCFGHPLLDVDGTVSGGRGGAGYAFTG